MSWQQTFEGGIFDYLKPDPATIDPVSLATSLSRLCRYSGHCRFTYSVAQHSIIAFDAAYSHAVDSAICQAILLHDAHEPYWGFGDIIGPAKQSLPLEMQKYLRQRQAIVDRAIAIRFDMAPEIFDDPTVHHYDMAVLATEKRDIMPPCSLPWQCWMPDPLPRAITQMSEDSVRDGFLRRLRHISLETKRITCGD